MFNKKEKKLPEWDDYSAPKKSDLTCTLEVKLYKQDSYNYLDIAKGKIEEKFIANSDSTKEEIKEELANKLEDLYNKMCILIDTDTSKISNNYWLNKELNKE